MNMQLVTEDWKEGARDRLSRRYKPEEAEELLKDREDYMRFKLNEAFKRADTNKDGAISIDELHQFLTQKGAEKKRDPNYELTALQKERIRQFYEDIDPEGSDSVDM